MVAEVETMAYSGETPWHGLGVRVPGDLSPDQMLRKAGLDWEVEKRPLMCESSDGSTIEIPNKNALIRSSDNKLLDVIGNGWEPLQNHDAFNFFEDFCRAGNMDMHTAGSLRGGKLVWALAKVSESFDILNGDQIDSYLLLSNPHMYGRSIDVRFTPIRVVCNNTLTYALNSKTDNGVSVNHRRPFNADQVKEMMGLATSHMENYKELAEFLSKKKANKSDLASFMNKVFPTGKQKGDVRKYDDLTRSAKLAYDVVETQPGADFAKGSWWQAFNAITYLADHQLGREQDTRLESAWYGANHKRKLKALDSALEYAQAA